MIRTVLKDWLWWYKQQAPKYGYISSLYTAYFNAMHFKKDGSYKINTNGTPNE